ncbi:hypothetical protein BO221_14095 [Archangium sp. Cb G35]|uniref:hypothetical protein n=1 Tax=Archangium sp. Cb G35 TaxID=1920190 RepID=UPI000935BCEF|nr:hypothetical protein [Archangium sp. Cb G35]OJT24303.1 hypothetical protein BO221_14095 [Archangium sp. Cb G35]
MADMPLSNNTTVPAEASPATSSPTPQAAGEPAVGPKKRPVDEEKRERDAADAQLRRELKALAKEKNADKLRAAAAKVRELRGEPAAQAAGQGEAPKPGVAALVKAEPGQKAGWPKPSEIAEQEGLMAHLWGEAKGKLPARYARVLEARVEKGQVAGADGKVEEVSITINPVMTLAKGTAPLAAQLLGKVNAMTPTAAAATAVALVFAPPFIEHMGELLFGAPSQPAVVGETTEPATPEAKA